jgi:hypothetical protein
MAPREISGEKGISSSRLCTAPRFYVGGIKTQRRNDETKGIEEKRRIGDESDTGRLIPLSHVT